MKIGFRLLYPQAKLPVRTHPGDLGFDLYAIENTSLHIGDFKALRTGVAPIFPEGWGGLLIERSSQALRGVKILGGVIDQGYRGEIAVIILNYGSEMVCYRSGERIGQLVPVQVFPGESETVETAGETTARAAAGFGSSGR